VSSCLSSGFTWCCLCEYYSLYNVRCNLYGSVPHQNVVFSVFSLIPCSL